ncbi:MAG: PAS domain S-box protein [Chloroflexi bacterium]|nr:PAS domain S-box protein [Chloroflexota bacterium]
MTDLTPGRPIHILVIDESRDDLAQLEHLLAEAQPESFRLEHVTRLDAALSRLAQSPSIDAILIALALARHRHHAALNKLNARAPGVPIIVLAGHSAEPLAVDALAAGAQDYLVKEQLSAGLLVRAMRYAIMNRRLIRQLEGCPDTSEAGGGQMDNGDEPPGDLLDVEHDFTAAVLNTVAALVIVLDGEGRIVRFNRACEQITGYRFDEVRGKTLWETVLPPEAIEPVRGMFHTLMSGDFPRQFENDWLTRSGQRRRIVWSNTALTDEQGRVSYTIGTGIDVTEQRQAEIGLQSSEERFRAIFDVAAVGIIMTDAAGHILESNPAAQAMLSYSAEELRDRTFQALTHADDLAENARLFEDMMAGRRDGYQMEKRYIRKDGQIIWVRVSVSVIRPADGSAPRSVGMIENITQRKEAEAAEHQQRAVAEALRDTTAALNSTLELDRILERLLHDVGRAVPHTAANIMLIDSGIARVVRGSGYEALGLGAWVRDLRLLVSQVPNLRLALEDQTAQLIADTQNHPDWLELPELHWIRSHIKAPIRREGQVIGFLNLDSDQPNFYSQAHVERLQAFADQAAIAIWNAQLYDTVRRHAVELEARVEERTAELEQQRAQLQAILDAMGEGVFYVDGYNQVRYINRAFARLLGYSIEEVRRRPLTIYRSAMAAVENLAAWSAEVTQTIAQGETWRGEIQLQRRDDTTFDAGATVTAVVRPDGEQIGRVELIRDISQEKALQAQKDRFIANASHELRTPITNIKMRLYLIRRQPLRLDDHLAVLDQVTERMESLVDDLLDLSRFERGVIELDRRDVVLQDLIERAVTILKPHADFKQIAFSADLPQVPLRVSGDPKRLTQVLTNLIVNAINYTPESGHIQLVLASQHDETGDYAIIRVRDSGVGISSPLLTQIFEPFFRGSEGSTIKGTGLGLTIAREIIDLHEGRIWVESQPGEGSSFNVRLALQHPAQSGSGAARQES